MFRRYICEFKDLRVSLVEMDILMQDPKQTFKKRLPIKHKETTGLHQLRTKIEDEGLDSAYNYVVQNPHELFWKVLAESALVAGDLTVAERAFVR